MVANRTRNMSLNYIHKLPRDTANIPSVPSELTGRETEEVSKELKKVQGKGKKRKKILCLDATTTS